MVSGVLFLKLLYSEMMFFWASLWAVKASFLCLINRLIGGLPNYKRWWWIIVVFSMFNMATDSMEANKGSDWHFSRFSPQQRLVLQANLQKMESRP